MKHLTLFILASFVLFLLSCGNRKSSSDLLPVERETVLADTTSEEKVLNDSAPAKVEKSEQKTSIPEVRSVPSKRKSQDASYDNMRGFDPASEDDTDDNGMSRYMENDDDEGWD